MSRLRVAVLIAAAALLPIAGCSAPPASPAPPAPPASPVLPDGTPREVATVVGDPCRLLSADQAADLGLTDPEARVTTSTMTCSWRFADPGDSSLQLNATALTGQSAPLDHLPRIAEPPGAVERTTVAGLPAVLAPRVVLPGSRCELGVLAAPGRTVELFLFDSNDDLQPPCEVVRRAAELMIANLPAPP